MKENSCRSRSDKEYAHWTTPARCSHIGAKGLDAGSNGTKLREINEVGMVQETWLKKYCGIMIGGSWHDHTDQWGVRTEEEIHTKVLTSRVRYRPHSLPD